jgi:DNA-binding transcriptional ArsR family regulator
MNDLVTIANALSDMNRVRALCALRGGEQCVCRIIDLLHLAPSTVSKHMQILKHAGLVESRKEERWIYYRIVNTSSSTTISGALEWLFTTSINNTIIENDRKSLLSICSQSAESLCKNRQKRQTTKQKAGSR